LGYVSTFYDAFNPEARKLFWSQINTNLYKLGIDGWWLDATEPDILSNISVEDRKALMKPTYVKSPSKYFNTYAVKNAQGIYEGQRLESPDKRSFILTRSAYAGLQRYGAATWSGDIVSRWEDFKLQIPAGLNFCAAGMPYWTTDIGGFAVEKRYEKPSAADLDEWRELQTRWLQYGAFCPLFRVHGQFPYREMFNIAPENSIQYKSMLYYDRLRYHLMPYIYSLAGATYINDYTIMRPLVMDFGSDSLAYNCSDQFMFGPAFMVAPVVQYRARTRVVYLPAGGGWYNLYTGEFYAGGQSVNVAAPLEQIPLFVKEGSIIPLGPEIQYATQKSDEPITLLVYTGKDCSFDLYEDDGLNTEYEKGAYSIIPVSYDEKSKTVTVGKLKGGFKGSENFRKFRIIWFDKTNPKKFELNLTSGEIIDYKGESVDISLK
jgi:alpha-D-xyloside xylohydrolase